MVRTLYKIVSICAYISYSFIYAFVDMDVDNDGASDLSVQNREILLEVSQKRKKLERLQKKVITSYCCWTACLWVINIVVWVNDWFALNQLGVTIEVHTMSPMILWKLYSGNDSRVDCFLLAQTVGYICTYIVLWIALSFSFSFGCIFILFWLCFSKL